MAIRLINYFGFAVLILVAKPEAALKIFMGIILLYCYIGPRCRIPPLPQRFPLQNSHVSHNQEANIYDFQVYCEV